MGVLVGGRIALDNLNLPLDIVPYSDVLYWVAPYVEDSLPEASANPPFSPPRASARSSSAQPSASASIGRLAGCSGWLAGHTGLVFHIHRLGPSRRRTSG